MKSRIDIKNPIGISIDGLARSIYVTLSNNKIAKTVKKSNNMIIDYDAHGKIVGVEIISLKSAQIQMAAKKSLSDIKQIIPSLV